MRNDGRKVLLLLDNVASHRVKEALTNVVVHMLPPKTTYHLQPQDAGSIQAFKKEINKVKRRYAVEKFDKLIEADGTDKENMEAKIDFLFVADVLISMKWTEEARATVTATTVTNCCRHAGVFDEDLYELVVGVEKLRVGSPTISQLVV